MWNPVHESEYLFNQSLRIFIESIKIHVDIHDGMNIDSLLIDRLDEVHLYTYTYQPMDNIHIWPFDAYNLSRIELDS